jgi:hypothetical protein
VIVRRTGLPSGIGASLSDRGFFSGFTVRLRFRVGKHLEITACEQGVEFGPYKAILSAQNMDQPICESEWLILRVRCLKTEEEAQRIGENSRSPWLSHRLALASA